MIGQLHDGAGAEGQDGVALGQFDDRDHRADRGVFEQGDEIVGDRRNDDAQGLRQDDSADGQGGRHAQRQGGFHLAARNGLQAGAIDFRFVGRVVDRQSGDGRHQRRQAPGRFSAAGRKSRTAAASTACRAALRRTGPAAWRRSRGRTAGRSPRRCRWRWPAGTKRPTGTRSCRRLRAAWADCAQHFPEGKRFGRREFPRRCAAPASG